MLIFEAMSEPLKFALIGCGKIAPRHAAEAQRAGHLSAVCDIIKERADTLALKFGATPYYDIHDLLEKESSLDVVAICTPNGLHASHSIACLSKGANVLCEKPLCIHRSEGLEMISAAHKASKNLLVVKSTRYNPILVAIKNYLDQQQWGQVYSFQLNCFWNRPSSYYKDSWKGTELDGGTLFTQFSHYIDALLWLLGEIKHVSGFRKNRSHKDIILSEDSGIAAVELNNGIIGGINWSVNSYQKNMEVSLTILAEKASVRIGGEYMNQVDYQCTGGLDVKEELMNAANDYGFYKGSMSNHDKVYENLLKTLKDPSHPFTNASDGLKTVEAIEMIYNAIPLSNTV